MFDISASKSSKHKYKIVLDNIFVFILSLIKNIFFNGQYLVFIQCGVSLIYHYSNFPTLSSAAIWWLIYQPLTNSSAQDKTWTKFSALEVAVCMPKHLLWHGTWVPNLELKTRLTQLLGSLPLDKCSLLHSIWGSVTHQMTVPFPSISCCVLYHHNLFYQILMYQLLTGICAAI